MDTNKCWAVYNSLLAVLNQIKDLENPETAPNLYSNVAAAVSSAKDLLVQRLQQTGNT